MGNTIFGSYRRQRQQPTTTQPNRRHKSPSAREPSIHAINRSVKIMSRLALPKGTTKGRKRSSARTLTSLFVGLTGVLGGLLTYMIVDRLYHSVDLVSNSNLISIDSLNVGDVNKQPRDRHQQQKQQQQQQSKITSTQQEPIQMQHQQQHR